MALKMYYMQEGGRKSSCAGSIHTKSPEEEGSRLVVAGAGEGGGRRLEQERMDGCFRLVSLILCHGHQASTSLGSQVRPSVARGQHAKTSRAWPQPRGGKAMEVSPYPTRGQALSNPQSPMRSKVKKIHAPASPLPN